MLLHSPDKSIWAKAGCAANTAASKSKRGITPCLLMRRLWKFCSRGAARECSHGRRGVLPNLKFEIVCERPPRSLRSRLLREGESRQRRQGSLTHHLELQLSKRGYTISPLRS